MHSGAAQAMRGFRCARRKRLRLRHIGRMGAWQAEVLV
jgi:hypothetical protein